MGESSSSEGSGASSEDEDSATGEDRETGESGTSGDHAEVFVYVGSGAWAGAEPGMISIYTYDPSVGSFAEVQTVEAGGLASYIARSRDGARMYSTDERNGGVRGYSVDRDSGELKLLSTVEHDHAPVILAESPDGRWLLAANYRAGSVEVYPLADGVAQTPLSALKSGEHTHSVAFVGRDIVLAANAGSDDIFYFSLSEGGQLGA